MVVAGSPLAPVRPPDAAPCNMGCTSSVPTAESQTGTTDNLQSNLTSNETRERSTKPREVTSNGHRELVQEQVLPECGIISKQTQLASHNNVSSPVKYNLDMDKTDIPENACNEIDDNTIHNTAYLQLHKNFSSLKDVVHKVITKNDEDHEDKCNDVEEVQNSDIDRKVAEFTVESNCNDGVIEIQHNDDKATERTSPTQSENSRATRWEALADIAAELPPSLAVDPLTGQIYSLTK